MKISEVIDVTNINPGQMLQSKQEIDAWFARWAIDNYHINSNLTVDITGHLAISDLKIKDFPVKFNNVSGYFSCSGNFLWSAEKFPAVAQGIYCYRNRITNFHNIHKVVKQLNGKFDFQWQKNQRSESSDDPAILPTHLLGFCFIKGITQILSGSPKVDKLFLEYKNDIIMFQQALIDAGFSKQAQI